MNTLDIPHTSENIPQRLDNKRQDTQFCLENLKKICENNKASIEIKPIFIDEKLYENYRKYYDHPIEESGEPIVLLKDFGVLWEDAYALWSRKTLDELLIQDGITEIKIINQKSWINNLPERLRSKLSRDIFICLPEDEQRNILIDTLWFFGYGWSILPERFDKIRRIIYKFLRNQELANEGYTNSDIQVRRDVVIRLQKINDQLKLKGYQIGVDTGYRSERQQEIIKAYEVHISGKENAEKLYADTGKSSHHSGWAIDTFLADLSWNKISLRLGNNSLETKSLLYGEKLLEEKWSELTDKEREIINGRRILFSAMTEWGFVPLITEYWHYGIWDRLSAYIESKKSGENIPAIYGNIRP